MKTKGTILALVLLFTLLVSKSVNAEEYSGLQIEPVFPSNQDSKTEGYININTESNTLQQKVEFKVTNTSSKPLDVFVTTLNSITSGTGVISYTEQEQNIGKVEDKYRFKGVSSTPSTLKIGANETALVTVDLDIQDLEGTILGGIGFEVKNNEVSSQETPKTEGKGTSIELKSKLIQVVGVQVNLPVTGEHEELKIGKPIFNEYPTVLMIDLPIHNNQPSLLLNSELDYEVVNSKGNTVFKSEEPLKANITPKSTVTLGLEWGSDKIVDGEEYSVKGVLRYDNLDKELPFDYTVKYHKPSKETVYAFDNIDKPSVVSNSTILTKVWDFTLETLSLLIKLWWVWSIGGVYLLYKKLKENKKIENETTDS